MASKSPPRTVDARGHRCPAPSLRLRRALEHTREGARLRLLADDPMARIDVPHLLGQTGDRLIELTEDGPTLVFLVEKTARGRLEG